MLLFSHHNSLSYIRSIHSHHVGKFDIILSRSQQPSSSGKQASNDSCMTPEMLLPLNDNLEVSFSTKQISLGIRIWELWALPLEDGRWKYALELLQAWNRLHNFASKTMTLAQKQDIIAIIY